MCIRDRITTAGGFDPTQAGNIANILMQRTMAPGGGAAGEIFQMRAFGFANPNITRYQDIARKRGIDPSMFKRRGLFEYRRFMEKAPLDQKIQAYLVGLEADYGGKTDPMANILGTALVPELGQERARKLVEMYKRGGLSEKAIKKFRGEGSETLSDVAQTGTVAFTSTFMELKKANDEYLNTILEFGGAGGIDAMVSFNKALRTMQTTVGNVTAWAISETSIRNLTDAVGELGKTAGRVANEVSGNRMTSGSHPTGNVPIVGAVDAANRDAHMRRDNVVARPTGQRMREHADKTGLKIRSY